MKLYKPYKYCLLELSFRPVICWGRCQSKSVNIQLNKTILQS